MLGKSKQVRAIEYFYIVKRYFDTYNQKDFKPLQITKWQLEVNYNHACNILERNDGYTEPLIFTNVAKNDISLNSMSEITYDLYIGYDTFIMNPLKNYDFFEHCDSERLLNDLNYIYECINLYGREIVAFYVNMKELTYLSKGLITEKIINRLGKYGKYLETKIRLAP